MRAAADPAPLALGHLHWGTGALVVKGHWELGALVVKGHGELGALVARGHFVVKNDP